MLKPFSIVSQFFGVFMQCHVWIHLVKYCHAECITEPDWICFWVDHHTTRRLAIHVQHSCVCLYLLAHLHVAKSLVDQEITHGQQSWAVWNKTTDTVRSQKDLRERYGEKETETEKRKSVCFCWPTFTHRERGTVSSASNLLCLGILQDAVVATATLRHTASHVFLFSLPIPCFYLFCLLSDLSHYEGEAFILMLSFIKPMFHSVLIWIKHSRRT